MSRKLLLSVATPHSVNPPNPTIPNASGRRINTCKPLIMKPEKKNMRPRGRVMKAKPAIAPLLSTLQLMQKTS
jgi:hypothetical protein